METVEGLKFPSVGCAGTQGVSHPGCHDVTETTLLAPVGSTKVCRTTFLFPTREWTCSIVTSQIDDERKDYADCHASAVIA